MSSRSASAATGRSIEAAEEAGLAGRRPCLRLRRQSDHRRRAGRPITSRRWSATRSASRSALASLVLEGVFERFPKLKMVMIEAGFGWAPSLAWRLDKVWQRLQSEVPHVKRPPSEYIREQVWWTTQPMEDPERREHLFDVDRLDRLGPAAVRDRLSALGLRRSLAGAAGRRQRRQPRGVLSGQCAEAVRAG